MEISKIIIPKFIKYFLLWYVKMIKDFVLKIVGLEAGIRQLQDMCCINN